MVFKPEMCGEVTHREMGAEEGAKRMGCLRRDHEEAAKSGLGTERGRVKSYLLRSRDAFQESSCQIHMGPEDRKKSPRYLLLETC